MGFISLASATSKSLYNDAAAAAEAWISQTHQDTILALSDTDYTTPATMSSQGPPYTSYPAQSSYPAYSSTPTHGVQHAPATRVNAPSSGQHGQAPLSIPLQVQAIHFFRFYRPDFYIDDEGMRVIVEEIDHQLDEAKNDAALLGIQLTAKEFAFENRHVIYKNEFDTLRRNIRQQGQRITTIGQRIVPYFDGNFIALIYENKTEFDWMSDRYLETYDNIKGYRGRFDELDSKVRRHTRRHGRPRLTELET